MSEIPPELIKTLNNLSRNQPISKENKIFIRDNLDFLQQFADDNELKIINPLFESLKKGRFTDSDKSALIQNKSHIVRIINKYEDKFRDFDEEEPIPDQVENDLDKKIKKYVFDKDHPMLGVSYNEKKNGWRIQSNSTNTSSVNKEKIIALAKNVIWSEIDGSHVDSREIGQCNNIIKKCFTYSGIYFMTYWYQNDPYFDIQHIILALDRSDVQRNHIYKTNSEHIAYYLWHKNEFDGFILRELIPEKIMYKIILHSRSDLSESFKDDVSDILVRLRKECALIITDNKLIVKMPENKKILQKHANIDPEIDSQIKNMIIAHTPLSYDNPQDMMQLFIFVNQIAFIQLGSFLMQSVLYAFIVPLKRDHRTVVVKFGWSDNILNRIETLQTELCCNIYLIGIKKVKSESVEKRFHETLDEKFPALHEPMFIKSKEKKELYKFSTVLMTEFNAVEEDLTGSVQEIILTDQQKTILRSIQNQHIVFQNMIMSHLNFSNMLTNISDSRIINSCAIMHYQFMALQSNNVQADSNNKHNEKMKQMDYDFKLRLHEADIEKEIKMHETNICKEVKMRELEVKLKEIELENRKLDI